MEHRILYRHFRWFPHSHRHLLRRIVLLAALFTLVLEVAALAQDTLPPPPPPDAAAAAPGQNSPQNAVRAVRVSDVAGQVQVWQDGQVAFNQAEPNMPAVEGMRFVTGEDGRLEIEFEDGSVARLAPNSSFRLTLLRRDAAGDTITRIDALTGLSYFELNGRDGQVAVGLDQESATPDGSAIFRIDLDNDPSELAVIQGEVHVSDGEGVSVDVHPDQTFQTDPNQAGEFTVADSVTANSWDQWNSDRDEALSQMESSETTARASTSNPDDAAWNDLDYYGSWYNVPGYGDVWSPNGVDADWDPYGQGYWGYYPAFGYTWISAYPWGWWPYHCGEWDYLNNWGWVWAPGGCGWGWYGAGYTGAGWFPFVPIWHHPPAYRPPMRPGNSGGRVPVTRMIAINRGSQYSAPFRFDHVSTVQPRPLLFNGTAISPLQAGIHPLQRGPLGETFTSTLVRTHPELAPESAGASGMPVVRVPPLGGFADRGGTSGYHPPHPAPRSAPRPSSGGADRGASPHVSGGASHAGSGSSHSHR